jgi:hypothetical protein
MGKEGPGIPRAKLDTAGADVSDLVVGVSRGHRFMLEASFILSEEGMAWLTRAGAQYVEAVSVSRALVSEIQRGEPGTLAWFGEVGADELGTLTEILGRARLFSQEEGVEVANERARQVRSALFAEHDPTTAEILADEWIFLQTQSWIGAKSRKAFDAFVAAGARMRELPRPLGRRLVARTLKKTDLPEHIPPTLLLQAGMKWIAAGGSAALSLVTPPVGIALGVAAGVFLLIDP